ncbi:SufD family Fe-S cluster assembly protein [Thermaurantiacus tibetensis]|uniref:SufD family Fe-S cluster assembly protein n=1 Tax=Thermaurantiacus tibetensis TaxID=2759035 RepID=UPI00188DF70B|nr:SufD family Fe-S cluster assembly protein [Thermaurantiacus tibetensis]
MRPELPTRRDEAWRWADLRHAEAFLETPAPANDALPETDHLWLDLAGPRQLFVAGQPVGAAAQAPTPDRTLPRHPLADLAAARATAGATLEIPAGADAGLVQLLHVGRGGAAHGITRVILGAGARLTLVESFADEGQDHWLNHRLDAELGPGAELVRVSRTLSGHGLVSDRAAVRMREASRFVHLTLGLGAASLRAEVEVLLEGAGAHAEVDGILLADGAAVLDALTRLDHRVPDTSSRQRWRLVAGGTAQASIAGGVAVARHAQKTDAEQSLKALLLRRTAAVNLKPELEIFADDVACAHGCTVGELDRAALFYLGTRGVPPAEAEALLTLAFVADALAGLPEGALQDALDAEARAWLARHAGGRA